MQKSFKDSRSFKKGCQKKVVQPPFPPCSQFSLIRDNYFYGVHSYFKILCIENFLMLLYIEINRLRPSSLSKHKTNLYFKEVITVNKEACSL